MSGRLWSLFQTKIDGLRPLACRGYVGRCQGNVSKHGTIILVRGLESIKFMFSQLIVIFAMVMLV